MESLPLGVAVDNNAHEIALRKMSRERGKSIESWPLMEAIKLGESMELHKERTMHYWCSHISGFGKKDDNPRWQYETREDGVSNGAVSVSKYWRICPTCFLPRPDLIKNEIVFDIAREMRQRFMINQKK